MPDACNVIVHLMFCPKACSLHWFPYKAPCSQLLQIIVVIITNVTAFALSTEEQLMRDAKFLPPIVAAVELSTVMLFTVEYILRLIACGEHDKFRGFGG